MEMAIENIMKWIHIHLPSRMAGITTYYSFPTHLSLKQIGIGGIETRVTLERIFNVLQQVCGQVNIIDIKLDSSLRGMQGYYNYWCDFWVPGL
jgi:hypothetical protein